MKLSKILHPEIVLDRRGPEAFRTFYRKTVREIDLTGEGGMVCPESVKRLNSSEQRAMALMRRFMLDNGKAYHVSKDFLNALYQVERDINLKYLPERFVGYFSFAEKTIWDDDSEIAGGYIYVGPSDHSMLRERGKKIIWSAYVTHDYKQLGTLAMDINEGDSMEDILLRVQDDARKKQPFTVLASDEKKRGLVFNVLLNLVMYLHSQEPNVQRIPGSDEVSNKKASEIAEKTGLRNLCSIPVTFINWNYAKQRIYTKDKTWVDTFPRWQPCGPGYSQVKLIWVSPHERTYKKAQVADSQTEKVQAVGPS